MKIPIKNIITPVSKLEEIMRILVKTRIRKLKIPNREKLKRFKNSLLMFERSQ
jgi:hypothetical protein